MLNSWHSHLKLQLIQDPPPCYCGCSNFWDWSYLLWSLWVDLIHLCYISFPQKALREWCTFLWIREKVWNFPSISFSSWDAGQICYPSVSRCDSSSLLERSNCLIHFPDNLRRLNLIQVPCQHQIRTKPGSLSVTAAFDSLTFPLSFSPSLGHRPSFIHCTGFCWKNPSQISSRAFWVWLLQQNAVCISSAKLGWR